MRSRGNSLFALQQFSSFAVTAYRSGSPGWYLDGRRNCASDTPVPQYPQMPQVGRRWSQHTNTTTHPHTNDPRPHAPSDQPTDRVTHDGVCGVCAATPNRVSTRWPAAHRSTWRLVAQVPRSPEPAASRRARRTVTRWHGQPRSDPDDWRPDRP